MADNSKQWWIFKDSTGQRSASFTMLWVSFIILALWLTLNIFEVPYIREFSGETALAWFTPLCVLYFGRKNQKGKLAGDDATTPADETE